MIVYQTENFGKHYEYRSNPHKNWVMPPHIHEFSEIAFTKSGTTTVILGGQKYLVPENHLIFIMPNRIHEYTDETESVLRCAVFSNDHIPIFFERLGGMTLKDPVVDMSDSVALLDGLEATAHGDTLRLCGLLNLICDKLLRATELVPLDGGKHSMYYDVIRYISENFREDITLADVAKKLGYHEKYLSSALHSLTGMNFRYFLSSYRINFAKHLMRSSEGAGLRVSDVALRCGFASINSFNRAFRELTGVTPTEYRKTKRTLQ